MLWNESIVYGFLGKGSAYFVIKMVCTQRHGRLVVATSRIFIDFVEQKKMENWTLKANEAYRFNLLVCRTNSRRIVFIFAKIY